MASITVSNLSIDFQIYDTYSRSLKSSLIQSTVGGAVNYGYNNKVSIRAIDNTTFKISEGDRVGLVGHNGSGKSTLLRVLAGIYEPSVGSVSVEGSVSPMLDIFLGMDDFSTGIENIILRLQIVGVERKKIPMMIEDIANFSGIGEYLRLPMKTYSSGMAMRLAFAIATHVHSEIILMEEWLSVGDEDFSIKAEERLNNHLSKAKIIVIASHDLHLIESQCNRIFHLEHGKIKEI